MGNCYQVELVNSEDEESCNFIEDKPLHSINKSVKKSRNVSEVSIMIGTNDDECFTVRKKFYYRDSEYTGQMILNGLDGLVPHGYGTQIWPDKSFYQGSFNTGLKQGNGKLTWPDNKFYVG